VFCLCCLFGGANALELVMPWYRMSLPVRSLHPRPKPASLYLKFAPVEFRRHPGHLALEVLILEPCEIDRKDPTLTKPLAAGVTAPRVVIRLSSCANKEKQDQHQKVYKFPCSKNRSGHFLSAAETGAESKCKGKRAPARQIKSQSNTLGSSLPS
jgi:hypothetical protein